MKVLLDTNIVVDILAKRPEFFEVSSQILSYPHEYCVSATTVTDLYYILRKSVPNTKQVLQEFLSSFTILEVNKDVCDAAFTSKLVDFEDAIQEQSAKHGGAAYIVTRNTKDRKKSEIPSILPDKWIEKQI